MKAELRGNFIWIDGENEEETHFLEVLDKNGVRVSGRSTRGIGITSPHIAGLRQLFINREQQAILAYSLGRLDAEMLLKSVINMSERDMQTLKTLKGKAQNISDLLDALIIAPEPVTPRTPKLTMPRRVTYPVPKVEPKKNEKEEKKIG